MGLAHVNGRHFLSFIKVCSSLLPRCFGFENVRGLMRHNHWSILERIIIQLGCARNLQLCPCNASGLWPFLCGLTSVFPLRLSRFFAGCTYLCLCREL